MDDSESARSEGTEATVRGAPAPTASPPPHERIGRYLVLGTVGEGAMGQVLRAYDPKLRREVALKRVHGARDSQTRKQVMHEARAMAQLSHPNIVAVFDVERDGATPFIAMEYVEGGTLRDWMDDGPHPWPVLRAAFAQAARGLEAAHAAGLVHRDFKPRNVLRRTDGRLQVTDFGIAVDGGTRSSDESHGTAGTPAYMAPEQHRGDPADARSDQYALCVVLWEALAGRRPFDSKACAENKMNLRFTEPSRPIPRTVRDVLVRGLDPTPQRRHASVGALMAALQHDPNRWRRPLLGAGVLVSLATIGVGVHWRGNVATQEACAADGEQIGDTWNAQVRAGLESAFSSAAVHNAQSVFERTVPWLDRFSERWAEARTQQCLAVRDRGDPTVLDTQSTTCFDEQRARFDALIAILSDPNAKAVQRAVKAVAGLPDPNSCRDEDTLRHRAALPEDATALEALAVLRKQRSIVAARLATKSTAGVVRTVEALLEDARAIGWAPATVDVLLVLAEVREYAGDYEAAAAAGTEAFTLALAVGYDSGALSACARLVYVVGYGQDKHDAGLQWSNAGDALATRLGYAEHHPRRLALQNNTAVLHWARGDFEASKAGHEAALATKRSVLGPEHPGIITTLDNLGITLATMGDVDGAQQVFEESLELAVSALGDDHPSVASVLVKLGTLAVQRGDGAEARAYLEKALPRTEAALGPKHSDVALVLVNLAMALLTDDAPELALQHATRAYALVERPEGEPHPYRAGAAFAMGQATATLGRFDDAETFFAESAGLRRASLPPGHPDRTDTEDKLARARFERAKALLERDASAALALAHAALSGVSELESSTALAAQLRTWIDAHTPPQPA